MKKKNTNLIKAASVLLVCATIATGCMKSPITAVGKSFVLEQGYALPTDMSFYVKGTAEELSKCSMDVSQVDANTVGIYKATIKHPKKSIEIEIKVVDTTGPSVALKTSEVTIEAGKTIKLSDVISEVSDNTVYQVGFADDITKADADKVLSDTLCFNEQGAYNSEVIAKDAYGNISVKPIVVIVTEKNNASSDITDNGENETETTMPSQTEDETQDTSQQASEETTQAAQKPADEPQTDIDSEGDFASYSKDYVPFGVGTDYDEDNRPTGLTWYNNHYGNYAVDFILPLSNKIYLTIDEGYENGYTGQILDTLKAKNVKAVFFITLPYAKDNPELVRRMIDEGHVVGNHSATHPEGGLGSLSVEKQKEEIMRVNDYVLENFGYQMYLFRFPTGAFTEQSLAIVESLGYRSVFWSFAHRDWLVDDQPDVSTALDNALDKAHGGAIYLLHAVSSTNTTMLGDFIDGCRQKGFEFGYYENTNK